MNYRVAFILSAIAGACLSPGMADAGFILDTGTPTGSGAPVELLTSDFAGEFGYATGETLTSLSAYLTGGSVQPGTAFDLAIYSSAGFTTTRFTNLAALHTTTATFENNGWTTTSGNLNWTLPSSGDYWLVLEPGTPAGLDLPLESGPLTGTVPALAFAEKTGSTFTTSGAPAIGLEITAVPLPASAGLLLSAMGGLGLLLRRRAGGAMPA